ncbi:hypothetical protein [Methylomagnum sp.]
MKTFSSVIAAASLLALASQAGAEEAIQLSAADMDGVTAGAIVVPIANAVVQTVGVGIGNVESGSQSVAQAATNTTIPNAFAASAGQNTSFGLSALTIINGQIIGGASAVSATASAATIQ